MPSTTYTRSGGEHDPFGRLADFSRFAAFELHEILDQMGDGPDPLGAVNAGTSLQNHAAALAQLLDGITTAD